MATKKSEHKYEILESIVINKATAQVKDFFVHISEQPADYRFKTHRGVIPVSASIDKVGDQFETLETFFIVPIRLRFETTEISDASFVFQLINPFKGLKLNGQFAAKELENNTTQLSLSVFSTTDTPKKLALKILFSNPFRKIISKQLKAELNFIRSRLETL
jgi:hypothetical protein